MGKGVKHVFAVVGAGPNDDPTSVLAAAIVLKIVQPGNPICSLGNGR